MTDQRSQRPWPAPSPDAGWWRGEAAGIPSAQSKSATLAERDEAESPAAAPDPGADLVTGHGAEHAPVARIEAPGRRRDDFPLWPTTTTVTVAERDDPTAEPADPTVEAAHLRLAVRDHLAGRPDQRPTPGMRVMRPSPVAFPRRERRRKPPRHPATGLASMLLVALLTGFFGWTSAEPFWLDMGHGVHGTATVTACEGSGVLRRCQATFRSEGATEPAADGVPLVGIEKAAGTSVEARMVPDGRIAYAGAVSGLRVRWAVGLGLVLLCGLTLSWLTGVWRLGRFRTRLGAWALTTAAPLVLAAGIVAASY